MTANAFSWGVKTSAGLGKGYYDGFCADCFQAKGLTTTVTLRETKAKGSTLKFWNSCIGMWSLLKNQNSFCAFPNTLPYGS